MNEQILAAVEDTLRRAKVFHADATLLVALSGGPDSVALLAALCELRGAAGFQVRAAHVEHGLRGEASLADARFCERLCAALRVPFTCDHAGMTGDMNAPGAEARARAVRYALLLSRARACHADALLLAHHLDDQAETVLAHLLRGSGARGLAGMRPSAMRAGILLLRPLLTMPKQQLMDALEALAIPATRSDVLTDGPIPCDAAPEGIPSAETTNPDVPVAGARQAPQGVPYRVDETNAAACCQRNRLRLEVLPLLTRENPRAAEHIAQSAALLALDEDCLQAQADTLYAAALEARPPLFCLRREPLLSAPPAVAVRTMRRFVAEGQALAAEEAALSRPRNNPAGVDPGDIWERLHATGAVDDAPSAGPDPMPEEGERSLSAQDSLALLRLLSAEPGATMGLPQGLQARAGIACLHLTRMNEAGSPLRPAPPSVAMPLAAVGGDLLFDGCRLLVRPYDPRRDAVPDGIRCVVLPDERLRQCTLRVPGPGDHIRPFGASGGKPLRRYLTDRRIDPPFRRVLPVLCDGREALWVVGIGAAEGTRLPPDDTPCTLICLRETPPWTPDQR